MGSKNPPKMELMAICRLEFYRKQKNWKFCSEERKGKEPRRKAKASNPQLNKTYKIEPKPEESPPEPQDPDPESPNLETLDPITQVEELVKPDVEECADLNEAFVDTETGASELDEPPENLDNLNVAFETETDKSPPSPLDPPGSPYSPRWSIQRWAEQRRLWHPEPTLPPSEPFCPKPTTQEPNYPNLENHHINQNAYQKCNWGSNLAYETIYPSEPNCPFHNCVQGPLNSKLGVNVVYYNTNMCHGTDAARGGEARAPDWGAAVAASTLGADRVDGGERADDWRAHIQDEVSRCESMSSVSSDEFVRGAVLAPHSTQIDLLSAESLPDLALAWAVAQHSGALRQLLDEARRRQQCPLSEPYIDEVPVRDPGPMGPVFHPPSPAFQDSVVAGSHNNRPDHWGHTDLGRGRGRLKVIGIDMGRPYRL